MKHCFVIIITLLCFFFSSGQEVLVVDEENNPVVNVSVFNSAKTKSALSNKDGVVNLSRFLSSDTIFMQHPNYKLKKILKSSVVGLLVLEKEYNILLYPLN